MTETRVTPPAPSADRDTAWFWDAVARGELQLQVCAECQQLRHPPGPLCPACGSLHWTTRAVSGQGSIYSAIVPRYPELPGFVYPYVVVLVELDEGPRMVANLRDVDPADARIGARVELFFEDHGEFRLPQFRLAGAVAS